MYIPLTISPSGPTLLGRQFTGDASRDTDIKIGIIVAIVLTAFIAGIAFFLYRYRGSIRCTRRRKHRHGRRRKSTGSSKSGRSAAGEEPPPPPPPGAEPEPPPPA